MSLRTSLPTHRSDFGVNSSVEASVQVLSRAVTKRTQLNADTHGKAHPPFGFPVSQPNR